MKKIIGNLLLAVCILCAAIGFSACEIGTGTPTPSPKESSISIDDLTLAEGDEKEIKVNFVNLDEQEITYAFQGNDIVIENGKVSGVKGGTVTTVTATTADGLYETTFKVTVEGLGTLTFEDLELKVGEQRKLRPKFSKPSVNETVTYAFEGDAISITDGVLKGLKEGTLTVTATSENYTATFTVTVTDVGTLTIDDVYMYVNSSYTITPKFSKDGYSEEITYVPQVKGVVSIEDGVITATKAGSTVVTAKSTNFNVKFNVTVSDIIDTDKAIVFTDYMITLYPNVYGDENVTLTTENTDLISIDGNNVKGLKKGTAKVTVSNGTVSKEVTVEVRSHDMGTDEGNTRTLATENDRLKSVMSGLESFAYTEGELVLFAGDSFMDERWFITDFYTTRFATKNAYTVGISSSRASAWIYMMQNFYKYSPKAIVLHIGTNDLFDGGRSADSVFNSVKTLLAMSHDNMPETEIYWWTIEQRIGQSSWNDKIQEINTNVKKYAKDKDWLKVVDTYTAMSKTNGDPDSSLYGDSVHPACPVGYDKLIGLTYDAGLEITDSPSAHGVAEIKTWTTAQSDKAAAARTMPLTTGNYLLHTDITVLSYENNAHITIPFSNDENRLLIWNSKNDGKFYYGGACGGYQSTSIDYLDVANGTKTASVDILVYNNNAYLFVNGKLERLFSQLPTYNMLKIGTEGCSVKFENTVVWSNSNQADLTVHKFGYGKIDGSNLELTDGAASFTVKIVASSAKMFLYVNDKLTLTMGSMDNSQGLANWNDLIIGAEGGATWKFGNVVFESSDGANYQKFINDLADGKTIMKAGTKTQLSDINAEYANAQYAEVTIYEPYGNMVTNSWSNHTIGIQLGIADKDGNEMYGFGSWHYGNLGYLLAWQQTAQSGTGTNDKMWNWMSSGLENLSYFTDWSKGVKISVAIIEGDLYAFWSIDGGTTWTKFVNHTVAGNANVNEKVAEPASISYIFCGVDGFYSDLSASQTVPENILALVA